MRGMHRRLDGRIAVERRSRSPAPSSSSSAAAAAAADGAVDGGWSAASVTAATPGVGGAAARFALLVAQLLLAAPLGPPIREPDLKRMPINVKGHPEIGTGILATAKYIFTASFLICGLLLQLKIKSILYILSSEAEFSHIS